MLFYKSSSRSTVLDRAKSESNDHDNLVENELVEAVKQSKKEKPGEKKSRLSTFEQELFQAWAED
jgi:hypothetical protein